MCYCDHICVLICVVTCSEALVVMEKNITIMFVTVIICVLDCVGHLCVDFVWVICVLICVLACNEALVSREDSMTMMCVLL